MKYLLIKHILLKTNSNGIDLALGIIQLLAIIIILAVLLVFVSKVIKGRVPWGIPPPNWRWGMYYNLNLRKTGELK